MQAQRHQRGARERADAGLALEHRAVQDQHAVLILDRPAVEGGHGSVELLATALTVAGLTGRPRIGNSALATLRVERPRTKQAWLMRLTSFGAPGIRRAPP